ncbi:MAG: branched-chain amino acid transport system ATP-binding protein [Mycobacterium sp.]|nr:branched-chain amino acid transport system ATP-binding protein [Mycobacterium sp.]
MMTGGLLVVTGLKRSFGGVHAVDGVSFQVERGSITGLIGPNGAGKSTALGAIAGALRSDAGSIEFDGEGITRLPPMKRARRGLIRTFQTSSEFERLTVLENLLVGDMHHPGETLFGAVIRGGRSWRSHELALVNRARELLERFEMADKEDEWAGNLSGGQKRLLEFGRIRMAEPRLVILDEPMGGVNPVLGERMAAAVLGFVSAGTSVVIVEHNLPFIERVTDVVVVMAEGRVIAEAPFEQLRGNQAVVDAYLGEMPTYDDADN